ncbi:MAG TPA: type II secretion system protein [Synergistaceae bacterium]|nr:type II secretion system protein [Synergistaceae bacterium]
MRRKKAFSLVELLCALIVFGILGAASLPLLSSFFPFYDFARYRSSCVRRGEQILMALEPFVLGAGMGMPSRSAEAFEKAFTFSALPFGTPYKTWGAVQVSQAGKRLRLVAGIPLLRGALEEVFVTPGGNAVKISEPLPEYARDCLCFVFPGSRLPFCNLHASGTNLLLQSSSLEKVSLFDEIHGVYATEFYLLGTTLYSRIYADGFPEVQPRGGDVAGFHCSYDEDSSILSVFLLLRSSRKTLRSHRGEIPGWNFSWPSLYDPAYYHVCLSRSWRVRN